MDHLVEILNLNSSIPSVNQVYLEGRECFSFQVEFHPYWHKDDLVDFCNKHDITFNSYSPMGASDFTMTFDPTWNPTPDVRKHPNVTAIAQKHGKSSAQVVFC